MKHILLSLLVMITSHTLQSQVRLTVTDLKISKLTDVDKNIAKFTDTPFIEATLGLENNSDTTMTFNAFGNNLVNIEYTLDSVAVSKQLDSHIDPIGGISLMQPIKLESGQKLHIKCSDYLYNSRIIGLYLKNDNTTNTLKILPTMKFIVKSNSGQTFAHNEIQHVNIQERPSLWIYEEVREFSWRGKD